MRNIGAVIDKMLAEIPASEEGFIHALNDIMGSVRYSPPESIMLWWEELTITINDYLPHPDRCEPWQTQVGLIFMDKA